MMRTNFSSTLSRFTPVAAAALVAGVGLSVAGPLNPPGGPVLPSMKPLSEMEPRKAVNAVNTPGSAAAVHRITLPGSYYLTGNVYGTAGKAGIVIEASDVTLDLNGFEVSGAGGTLDGVAGLPGMDRIVVKNGTVNGWGEDGVDLYTGANEACVLRNVTCGVNSGRGMRIGNNGRVEGCTADSNTGIGIDTGFACTVAGCTATRNTGNGIDAAGGCIVRDCVAKGNGTGIATISECRIDGCVATGNITGMSIGAGSVVSGCTVSANVGTGLSFGSRCLVSGNVCSGNGTGIASSNMTTSSSDSRIEGNMCVGANVGVHVTGPGNFIVRNTCSGNTVNWSFAANNVYGPIIDRSASSSPAVGGNSAAGALGSSEPNANFTY